MSHPATDSKCVAILLCTYNGGRFLKEQLDSIAAQSHTLWVVYASDDGSSDETLEILRHYRETWGHERLLISEGPQRGFSSNFLSVLGRACGNHGYYAFCDQDDLWHPTKLRRALDWMERQPATTPSLYCSRTRIVDEAGNVAGLSPLFNKPPSFENALMQSLAGGNTMMINQPACSLLNLTPANTPLVCHDWWAYLLITGCGGTVYCDPEPTLNYRQHTNNVIGANTSVKSRMFRLKRMFQGSFRKWNVTNIAALELFGSYLTPHNRAVLQRFEQARKAPLIKRTVLMVKGRFYRQTLMGNFGLALAVVIKRI